jgi:hypothetical protein
LKAKIEGEEKPIYRKKVEVKVKEGGEVAGDGEGCLNGLLDYESSQAE